MNIHSDILTLANKYPLMLNEVEKLQTIERIIPGSVTYSIHRYKKNPQWSVEDVGMLSYNFEKTNPEANSIELKFCISGNIYCHKKQTECDFCQLNGSKNCVEKTDSIDVLSFSFSPVYLQQFTKANNDPQSLSDNV